MKQATAPDDALVCLMAGNANHVSGSSGRWRLPHREQGSVTLHEPFAMVLSCAEGCASPEHIFDLGSGELFVCRVAGNVLDEGALASFEYAVQRNGSPSLLVILAHQRCDAIAEAVHCVESGKSVPAIQPVIDAISPVISLVPRAHMTAEDYIDAVACKHAEHVASEVPRRSELLSHAIEADSLRIVSAFYSIDTGRVSIL